MSIEQDGKRILSAGRGDDGFPGIYTMWRYFKDTPLKPVEGAAIQPDPDRPLEARLRGKISVTVGWPQTRSLWSAETSELKLRRQSADSDSWFVDPDWVEANGPPGDPEDEARKVAGARWNEGFRVWSTIAVVLAFLVGFILALTSLVMRWLGRAVRWRKRLAGTALMLCFLCLAGSSIAHWYGSEALGAVRMPYPSAVALALALVAFIVCRSGSGSAPAQQVPNGPIG